MWNLHRRFVPCSAFKSMVDISQIFVAFSEYINNHNSFGSSLFAFKSKCICIHIYQNQERSISTWIDTLWTFNFNLKYLWNQIHFKSQYFGIKPSCILNWKLNQLIWIHLYKNQRRPSFSTYSQSRTTDTQWMHKSKISEKLGRCGRQNMLRSYLKN